MVKILFSTLEKLNIHSKTVILVYSGYFVWYKNLLWSETVTCDTHKKKKSVRQKIVFYSNVLFVGILPQTTVKREKACSDI